MLRTCAFVFLVLGLPRMALASDPACYIALEVHEPFVTIKAIVSDAPGASGNYSLQVSRKEGGNRSVTSQAGSYSVPKNQSQVVSAQSVVSVTGQGELVADMWISTSQGEFTCSANW